MQQPTQLDEPIARFAEALRERLGPRLLDLRLFGSRARGDASPDSDYDCLVIVDAADRDVTDAIDDLAGDILYETGAVVSAFPLSRSQADSRKYSPFLINAMREGIPI